MFQDKIVISRRQAIAGGASLLAAAPLAARAADTYPSYYPASYAGTVAAAKQEGQVAIYSTTNAPNTQAVWADFQALYPGVKVNVTNMSSSDVYNRFLSEEAGGTHEADILFSNAMDLQMQIVRSGKALRYASPEKSHFPDWAQYDDMIYAVTMDPDVIVYNKKQLPAALVPKDHAGLLDLLTKQQGLLSDKVVTYDVKTTGSAYVAAVRDSEKWPDYWKLVKAFGKVGARYYQAAGTMVELVAAGQFILGYNIPYPYALLRERSSPDLGHVLPDDFTVTLSRVLLIAKNAPHPNAAKLFMDYLLSQRGQQLVSEKGALVAIRSDVSGPATMGAIMKQIGDKISPIHVDPQLLQVLVPAKRIAFLRRWQQAINAG